MAVDLSGVRLAVAGMGRSGIGIAAAAIRRGAVPTVYDQQSADTPERLAALEQLDSLGVAAVTGWHGHLDASEFDVLVASPGFRREHPAIRDALRGGREVVSEVEFAYRIARAPIVAITGTNGKSTTTVLIWLLLRAAGVDAVLCGNLSGSGFPELTLTEAADRSNPEQVLVAEVSSYQLEWVRQFRPQVATITNVTPDHLDRHPTFEDYLQTKLRIFDAMSEGDTVVLNSGEPSLAKPLVTEHLSPGVTVVEYGDGCRNRPTTDGIDVSGFEVSLADTALDSTHGRINACGAWTMTEPLLKDLDSGDAKRMAAALREFRGLANRMELLGERDGIRIINNSMCTNPAAVIASCEGYSREQTLLIGGNTKNLSFEPLREMLDRTRHRVVLFGPETTSLNAQLGGRWPERRSLEEAFDVAVAQSVAGSAVVLSPGCASAFPYANFRERGDAFKDIAKRWLEK